jgi:hypothetical protein
MTDEFEVLKTAAQSAGQRSDPLHGDGLDARQLRRLEDLAL